MSLDFDPRQIRLVMFDFDGVILESADIKTEAFQDLFADYPMYRPQILEYHLAHQGISRFKKFDWIHANLLKQPLSRDESKALGKRFSALVLQKVLAAPFVPGATELVRKLAAHGIPMAVISGTPQEELDFIVERRGIRRLFEAVIGAPVEKPEAINRLLGQKAVAPTSALFVGDGLSDHSAAVAAGVHFVARQTRSAPTLWRGVKLSVKVEDLTPLLEWPWPG